jgi:aprataxin
MSSLKKLEYEPLLKEDLMCFRCGRTLKNMPLLKTHLQEEWNALRSKGASKRKADIEVTSDNTRPAKKADVGSKSSD